MEVSNTCQNLNYSLWRKRTQSISNSFYSTSTLSQNSTPISKNRELSYADHPKSSLDSIDDKEPFNLVSWYSKINFSAQRINEKCTQLLERENKTELMKLSLGHRLKLFKKYAASSKKNLKNLRSSGLNFKQYESAIVGVENDNKAGQSELSGLVDEYFRMLEKINERNEILKAIFKRSQEIEYFGKNLCTIRLQRSQLSERLEDILSHKSQLDICRFKLGERRKEVEKIRISQKKTETAINDSKNKLKTLKNEELHIISLNEFLLIEIEESTKRLNTKSSVGLIKIEPPKNMSQAKIMNDTAGRKCISKDSSATRISVRKNTIRQLLESLEEKEQGIKLQESQMIVKEELLMDRFYLLKQTILL